MLEKHYCYKLSKNFLRTWSVHKSDLMDSPYITQPISFYGGKNINEEKIKQKIQ